MEDGKSVAVIQNVKFIAAVYQIVCMKMDVVAGLCEAVDHQRILTILTACHNHASGVLSSSSLTSTLLNILFYMLK